MLDCLLNMMIYYTLIGLLQVIHSHFSEENFVFRKLIKFKFNIVPSLD